MAKAMSNLGADVKDPSLWPAILEDRESGMTLEKVGIKHNITREKVRWVIRQSKKAECSPPLVVPQKLKPCICGAAAQYRLDNRAMLIDCVDVDCYWQLRQPYLDGSHTWESVKAAWNNRPRTKTLFDKEPIADAELISMLDSYGGSERMRSVISQNFKTLDDLLLWMRNPDREKLQGSGRKTFAYMTEMLSQAGVFSPNDILKRKVEFSEKQRDRWQLEKSIILDFFETGCAEKSALNMGVSKSAFSEIVRKRLHSLRMSKAARININEYDDLITENNRTTLAVIFKNSELLVPYIYKHDAVVMGTNSHE